MKTKYLKVAIATRMGIDECPNIDRTGSVKGMKKLFWGENALVVKSGRYYFNVTKRPDIYHAAK